MANPGYVDIFGAIQGQQLQQAQIAEAQALAGYRQAETAKMQQAMRDQAVKQSILKSFYSGQPQPAAATGAGAPVPASAPIAEMGQLGSGTFGAMPSAAPAGAPAGTPAPMGAQPSAQPSALSARQPASQTDTVASALEQSALRNTQLAQQFAQAGYGADSDELLKTAGAQLKDLGAYRKDQAVIAKDQAETAKTISAGLDDIATTFAKNPRLARSYFERMFPGSNLSNVSDAEFGTYVSVLSQNSKAAADRARVRAETAAAAQLANQRGQEVITKSVEARDAQRMEEDVKSAISRKKSGGDVADWELTVEGQKKHADAVAKAAAGANGARSALVEQRQDTLAVNATEFVRTLGNIKNLPATASAGLFGGKTATSLFTAPVEAATNTLTSDSVQRYNTEMGGLGNHLSWMVSGGMNPSQGVQEKFDQILKIKEGDTPTTVLTKLARARQEAENVLVVKEKSRLMSPEMKTMLGDLQTTLKETIPFTVDDVNAWANRKDKKQTFGDFIAKSGVGRGQTVTVGGQTYSRPPNFTDEQWNAYKKAQGVQ